MSDPFKELAQKYVETKISTPGLKVVTLAQWALESNFGKSALATDHKNFGGLKFRARINENHPYATPVDYEAHDGLDTYCAFASLQDFILGYWEFINNGGIYSGWEDFADDPSGYIAHLHGNGYAGDPKYVSKVMKLVPTINAMLEDLGATDTLADSTPMPRSLFKLAILIGHNKKAQGAFSQPMQISEWKFNQRIFKKIDQLSPQYEIEPRQFFREPSSGYSKEIADAYAKIDAWGPTAILELHFNSATGNPSGTEMLYWPGSAKGKLLADKVREAMLDTLKLPDRGSKARGTGNGSTSLQASQFPTILTEPFFGNTQHDCDRVMTVGDEAIARAYLIGARDAMEDF